VNNLCLHGKWLFKRCLYIPVDFVCLLIFLFYSVLHLSLLNFNCVMCVLGSDLCLTAAQRAVVIVSEAEYMYRLRKDIIPLVLEPGYVPDGWLGILIGTKLFFDLSRPATFDAELERLIQELGSRGRLKSLASASTPNSPCLQCQ